MATPINLLPADGATGESVVPTLIGNAFVPEASTPSLGDYSLGWVNWVTTTYQTGGMRRPMGAWACDDTSAPAIGGTIADYSVAANPLTVTGTVTRTPYLGELLDRQGIVTDDSNFVQAIVTGAGPLAGYIKLGDTWAWKADLLSYPGVTLSQPGGVLTIKDGSYAELVWSSGITPIDFGGFDTGFDEGYE